MAQIYRDDGESLIKGIGLPAFRYVDVNNYSFINIYVYKDGMIECNDLLTLEQFEKQLKSGKVVTTLPEGARVSIYHLSLFTATKITTVVPEADLLQEIKDRIDQLNGRPTSRKKCFEAFLEFLIHPGEENREKLRIAYEAVPIQLRRSILGDMDLKDGPIRAIIYQNKADEAFLNGLRELFII